MNEEVTFRAGIHENKKDVAKRIKDLFERVKIRFDDVFDKSEEIKLDDDSIHFFVAQIQDLCVTEAQRDAIADAFEVFVSNALKGEEGQFFTPRNVIKMMVEIINPKEDEMIIDPACGTGGFLIESLKHVWSGLEKKGKEKGWKSEFLREEKQRQASKFFRGIDKDAFVAKVTKAYMAIMGDGRGGIFCESSLDNSIEWSNNCQEKIELGKFDILMTNPPFGSKIKMSGEKLLKQYELGYKWKKDKKIGEWIKTQKLKDKEEPQILFLERCIQLLKEGGRMRIVLPDGIFGNESLSYLRNWFLKHGKVISIIDLPLETFQPNTSTKTSILFFQKIKIEKSKYPVFMAVAENCGHDRRGKEIKEDDIKNLSIEYKKWSIEQKKYFSKENYFSVNSLNFINYDLWCPKFLFPRYNQSLKYLKSKKIKTIKFGDLFTLKKGVEIGSKNYIKYIFKKDTDKSFIRTSDLVNYTINRTADLYLSSELFNSINFKLEEKDILFTKDGKIGIIAIVSNVSDFLISAGIARCRMKEQIVQNIFDQFGIRITPEYVFSLLITKEIDMYQALQRTVVAATIPHFSMERLRDIEIPLFLQKEIDDITEIVKNIIKLDSERMNLIDLTKNKILNQINL